MKALEIFCPSRVRVAGAFTKMMKLPFLCAFLATSFCLPLSGAPAREVSAPNVILIMADDLGFETIGANGGTSYSTPALDRLASGGVRFTHCFSQPLCTPTRVQLMTGLYNVRNYINFGLLDPKSITFAHLLKSAGYSTCIAGKWQLGTDPGLPKKFGFDEHCLWQHTRRPPRYANPGLEVNGEEKDYNDGGYGPTLVNDYALDYVTRKKDSRFFLYYPMILTHSPYQPTPDSKTWDPKAIGEKVNQDEKHFGEMVTYMDKMIGRLIARLDELKIRDQTLVIFLGDNGTGKGTKSMMGAREVIGGKGTTKAAGMHVPLIVNWPGGISGGKVCGDLVDTTDMLPTLMEAAGAKPGNLRLDGRSFLPQLVGRPSQPREWVYSWYSPRMPRPDIDMTVRELAFNKRFKLYRTGEFYDLEADPDETKPIALNSLKGDAATSAATLQKALDQFKNARPARLDELAGDAPKKKRKGRKESE